MNDRSSDLTPEATGDVIKVDVWSDVQCPWCYIGKRRFERAVRDHDGAVEVTYHSFELAPDTPLDFDGSSIDYLVQRKGMSPDQVKRMLEHVTALAADEGLAFDFDSVHHINTVRAHEVLHLAKAHGCQGAMKERLLRAYFEEGANLGRIEVLTELAAEVGLEQAEVVTSLADRRYLPAVKADGDQARAYGISGVPFYVLNGQFGVSGAQPTELFAQALTQAGDADG